MQLHPFTPVGTCSMFRDWVPVYILVTQIKNRKIQVGMILKMISNWMIHNKKVLLWLSRWRNTQSKYDLKIKDELLLPWSWWPLTLKLLTFNNKLTCILKSTNRFLSIEYKMNICWLTILIKDWLYKCPGLAHKIRNFLYCLFTHY